ncbi:hypothetical protein K432DRAFT_405890 [Lepidopterella palustris CBS 459.81]|uniref:Uncharacterized protein n=1 Tax=Lepidopterella palustris CBS 459.81 TaxID=1314670 RepID=A0A8E2JE48_9PEZI|nr:hypothetical protein K432DRAFT_405890 [Lepidopterella palustris CBS 459.81]
MASLNDVLGLHNFDFNVAEIPHMVALDTGFLQYYTAMDLPYSHLVRDGQPGTKISLLWRAGLVRYLTLLIRANPEGMCERLNALLGEENRPFIDSLTDAAFTHKRIPIECSPAAPDAVSMVAFNSKRKEWVEKRAGVIPEAQVSVREM